MKHRDIWRGLDALAAHHGLTPSGLARRAGLDPTAFNPSKREGADGRPRWPSTESLARVLESVGSRFEDFAALVDGRRGAIAPLIGFAQAGQDGFFDDAGFPVGGGWEEVRFPGLETESVYALEISGDSMEPAYRADSRPGRRRALRPFLAWGRRAPRYSGLRLPEVSKFPTGAQIDQAEAAQAVLVVGIVIAMVLHHPGTAQ